jgi:hypothetical protein
MNFIIMFKRIGKFFAQCALARLGKVYLVMIFIAVEDVIKIDCLIGNVEGYSDDCDQVMQLGGLKLSRASLLGIFSTIPVIRYQAKLSRHGKVCD